MVLCTFTQTKIIIFARQLAINVDILVSIMYGVLLLMGGFFSSYAVLSFATVQCCSLRGGGGTKSYARTFKVQHEQSKIDVGNSKSKRVPKKTKL